MNKRLVLQLLVTLSFLVVGIKASVDSACLDNKSGRHIYVGSYGSMVVDRVPEGGFYSVCAGVSYLIYPRLPVKDAKVAAISISFASDKLYGAKTMTVVNGMQVDFQRTELEAYQGTAQIKPGFILSNVIF